jgi:hypothetical protein
MWRICADVDYLEVTCNCIVIEQVFVMLNALITRLMCVFTVDYNAWAMESLNCLLKFRFVTLMEIIASLSYFFRGWGGTVGRGIALLRVRFPMVSLEFFIEIILPAALSPLTEMSTRRGKGGRCVRLTTLPPSCADCFEIWEPQLPGTLTVCSGLNRVWFIFKSFQRFLISRWHHVNCVLVIDFI